MGNENKDVIRVFDTAANLPTAIRNGMIAYDTTNDRIGVKRLADGTMIWYDQSGTVDTTDIVIDDNSATAFRVRESSNNYFAVDTQDGSEIVYIGNLTTDPEIILNTANKVYINETSNANMTIGLTIDQGDNSDEIMAYKDSVNIAHGITDHAETDTYGYYGKAGASAGGLLMGGITTTASTTPGIRVVGYIQADDPTYRCIVIDGAVKSGTGVTTTADTTKLVQIRNNTTEKVYIAGNGDVWIAGDVDTDVLKSNNATELLITNENGSSGDIRLYPVSGDILHQGVTQMGNPAGGNYLNVDAGGAAWWVGANAGLLYGSAQTGTTSIAWVQTMAQNTWYEISDSDIISGNLLGITHDGSGKLTVATAGVYDAMGIITMASDTINKHSQITFSVNGTPRTTTGVQSPEMCGLNDDCLLAITDTLDLAANDTVEIAVRTTDAGNPDFTVSNLSLKLKQIGGT
jgi:hypothetical protein